MPDSDWQQFIENDIVNEENLPNYWDDKDDAPPPPPVPQEES